MVAITNDQGQVIKYEPDSAPIPYTPPGVSPNQYQFLRIFLPSVEFLKNPPPGGLRCLMLTGTGGFSATTAPSQVLANLSEFGALPFEALRAGWVLGGFGVSGFNATPPVLGNATFDLPSSTVADLNHHDDVGDSLDGGETYPFQDYPTPFEDAQMAVQKMKEVAEVYGVNPDLIFIAGRSSGGVVASHPLFGPDRGDPEMLDHRCISTRVAGAVLWSQIGWLPAYDPTAQISGAKFFPNAADPLNSVCDTISQAPSVWPREASWLRFGFKDYLDSGPGISGDDLRELNGQVPVILVNTDADADLGLKAGTTPTEAVQFVGDDATDSRVPAVADVVDPSVPHPAFMGLLAKVRLREVQVDGFHDANSTLIMRQSAVDALQGHTAPDGTPLPDLVDTTFEEHETVPGGLAAHVMTLLEAQAVRIEGPPPAADPPPQHPRTIIRKAVVAILTGKVSLNGVELPVREAPYRRIAPDKAELRVYTGRGRSDVESDSPRVYERTLSLDIEIASPGIDGLSTDLDEVLRQLEELIESEACLGLLGEFGVTNVFAGDIDEGAATDGSKVWAAQTVSFDVVYHEASPREPIDLAPLQKLGIAIDLDPSTEEQSSEDDVYLPI